MERKDREEAHSKLADLETKERELMDRVAAHKMQVRAHVLLHGYTYPHHHSIHVLVLVSLSCNTYTTILVRVSVSSNTCKLASYLVV